MIRAAILLFCSILLSGATVAHAASIESLLMPGPVIQGHAKYEDKCDSCHESFSKKEQRRLCLDCHKDIADDVRRQQGLHGRRAADKAVECKSCHSEHKGRDADIVLLVPQTFDHATTDFRLEGKHQSVRCISCHVAGKKYSEAPLACADCHRKQDAHGGSLGEKCGDCHKSSDWKRDARFEHDKTRFSLRHRHSEITCAACHPDGRYKDTPQRCISCHQLNDVHGGRLGDDCKQCHGDKSWKDNRFDHDKTKFPLRHGHRKVACGDCHRTTDARDKPPRNCSGCHGADDVHKGRNGVACSDCHDERKWKDARFDHLRASGYALRGKHKTASCSACHRGPVHEVALERACQTCHQNTDVHAGKLGGECERCHNEQGWGKQVAFDHDLTRFPLGGLHASAPCEACHVTPTYRGTQRECKGCHSGEDSHKGALGEACGTCHNPNGWRLWKFNHDRDTKFVLDGAHSNLACNACHRPGVKNIPGQACSHCHGDDDAHHGSFGQLCDRCHVTTRFDDLRLINKTLQPKQQTSVKGK